MKLYDAIRTALREAIVDGSRPDEAYSVKLKPGLATAVWIWQPPHRIYVGDGVLATMRPALSVADQLHYIASFVFHEYSHARHTCRDHDATRAMLARVGCSMDLLNLFEDARIEAAWRGLTARRFRWSELEIEQPGRPASASGAFLEWIQQEGDVAKVAALADRGMCDEVESFYRRAIATESTLALEPLLVEWKKLYGDSEIGGGRFVGGPGKAGELQIALNLLVDPAALHAFDAGTTPIGLSPLSEDDPLGSVEVAGIGDGELLSDEAFDVDEDAARRHAERLIQALTVKSRAQYTLAPSARASAWRIDTGRPAYRHRVEGRVAKRRRVLVVDCSGSMDGEHIEAARTLVRTMSLLAERGALEGELILSAVARDESLSESHAWPVPVEVTSRIHAFGDAEGLADAIDSHLPKLRSAEKLYVFTDGNICDKPMRLAALRRAGVEVIGLYVGNVEAGTRGLQRHFDRFAARETLAGLVDFLITDR